MEIGKQRVCTVVAEKSIRKPNKYNHELVSGEKEWKILKLKQTGKKSLI